MDSEHDVNSLYVLYADARSRADTVKMEEYTAAIYAQAEFMASHVWGGPREYADRIRNPLKKAIHEMNWDALFVLVHNALKNFDPERESEHNEGEKVKFSSYLFDIMQKESGRSATFLTRQKRHGQVYTQSFEQQGTHGKDDFTIEPVYDGDAPTAGAEESDLTDVIVKRLRPLLREYRDELKYYLVRSIDEKTLDEVGEEFGCSGEWVRQQESIIKGKIQPLLLDLYEDNIDRGTRREDSDTKKFARALKAALVTLNEERIILEYRSRNPKGDLSKPSFAEMLEHCHSTHENFVTFLFEHVLPTWDDMSQVKFCEHIRTLNAQSKAAGDSAAELKDTFTGTVLSGWSSGRSNPSRENVAVMCRAFGCMPENNQIRAKHEKMLWQAIHGHRFVWPITVGELLIGNEGIKEAILSAKKNKDHGPLLSALCDASGMPFERIKEALSDGQKKLGGDASAGAQLNMWRQGQVIRDMNVAMDLVTLFSEVLEGPYKAVQKQKVELLSLFTGRQFDIDVMLADAAKAGNPGGSFFTSLIGENGMVPASIAQIAEELNVNERRVRKARSGNKMQKGGAIDEAFAESIMQVVEKQMKPLIDKKILTKFTPEKRADCIDVLCNCPHPRKMMEASIQGEYVRADSHSTNDIGDIIRRCYERKGLNQAEFAETLGLAKISNAVLGKAYLNHESSRKVADWLAENYELTQQEQHRFMAMAQGVDMSKTPDQLLTEVMLKKDDVALPDLRTAALLRMYDQTGLTRPELAAEAGTDGYTLNRSVLTEGNGLIYMDGEEAIALAKALGISKKYHHDFVEAFVSPHYRKAENAVTRT